ncbi:MAG: Hsp33 family molecular chaperone HslO [Desulfuromonadaceae bacterium]|nr:Hsp33 family molecular chaperone HslO [Geobacteraceae bacterium]
MDSTPPRPDTLVRGMSNDGAFRVAAVNTTNLSAHICRLQQTDPTASVALGRVVSAASLMISQLKGNQRLALSIEGNGPLKKLHAEVSAQGHVCASIKNPVADIPPRDNNFDVAAAVGRAGFLRVVKDLGMKEPYSGMVQLSTSEIGDDVAQYFAESEQTPTSVALGVMLDRDGHISACGGLMLQVMPQTEAEKIDAVENHIKSLHSISGLIAQGATPEDLIQHIFPSENIHLYPPAELKFKCHCSKSGVARMLSTLGTEELQEMQNSAEENVVTCEYCRTSYSFTPEEVGQIIETLQESRH